MNQTTHTQTPSTPPHLDKVGPGIRYLLASASQRRRDILQVAGMIGITQPNAATEAKPTQNDDPQDLTRRNALAKLNATLDAAHGRIPWNIAIIAADTIVYADGNGIGKPADRKDAIHTLQLLRGRNHQVVTTVAMTYPPHRQHGQIFTKTVASLVEMRKYTDREIQEYIDTGIPYDRAGSYGVQDSPFAPATNVQGCYLNVIGLPLCAVVSLLPPDTAPFLTAHIYATCAQHQGNRKT